jgi:hypothetical protein
MLESNDMNKIEEDLLNNSSELSYMNNLLRKYQFTENFLIKTRIYYDSWKCLRTQKNLSPYFCFRYLYDTPEYDSADDWVDYNQVVEYLNERNINNKDIKDAYNRAMNDKNDDNNST